MENFRENWIPGGMSIFEEETLISIRGVNSKKIENFRKFQGVMVKWNGNPGGVNLKKINILSTWGVEFLSGKAQWKWEFVNLRMDQTQFLFLIQKIVLHAHKHIQFSIVIHKDRSQNRNYEKIFCFFKIFYHRSFNILLFF